MIANNPKNSLENLSSMMEKVVVPENKQEHREQSTENKIENTSNQEKINNTTPTNTQNTNISPTPSPQIYKDKITLEIEKVLEEDLESIYFNLPENKRMEFKVKGEEVASKINLLLTETKVKVKKIVDLIKEWLLMIPNVNRFFLEQESKIKTDKILKLNNK